MAVQFPSIFYASCVLHVKNNCNEPFAVYNRMLRPDAGNSKPGLHLCSSRVIWLDKQRSRCRIYWKSPAEWAELVYDWASRLGFRGTVCTLYEITHGPDSAGESFQNLDDDCLLDALRHLEKCGKAESREIRECYIEASLMESCPVVKP
ncbi:hypothetical protein D918_05265 [Trichuris suis]|nr:hypothetical protein D918_05265 [Trichuris suis]